MSTPNDINFSDILSDTPHHHNRLFNEKGDEIECTQRDTIQRIFTLWRTLETQREQDKKEALSRDEKIKEAYDNNTKELQALRQDLENRRFINNYNDREKELLRTRVDEVGGKAEKADIDIYTKVDNHNTRLSSLESDASWNKWLLRATFGAIVLYVAYIIVKDFYNF